jgi:hypothetical protein
MAEQTQTATEYNFKRPDGSYGTAWNEKRSDVNAKAQACIDALKGQGALDQSVEIVSRTRTTTFSEESHYETLSTTVTSG